MGIRDRFVDAFIDAFAKLSATTLVALISSLGAASVASTIAAYKGAFSPWVLIPIALVLALMAILAFRIVFRQIFVIYPRRESTHEVLSKHFLEKVEVIDGKRMISIRRHYKIRVLQNGLDTIREPYLWTGTDRSGPTAIGGTCTVGRPYNDTIWTIVDLQLNRTYNKGEEFVYELLWRLDDTDRTSRPFLSAPTNEPTRHLKFSLFLPDAPRVREVRVEQRRSIDSLKPFKTEVLPFGDGYATWDKKNPGRYFYYCVRWQYDDE